MRRSKPLELGTWNAVCDRCGWYFKAYELRKEWTGLMTCHGPGTNDCWDPKHPQLTIQAVPDSQVVPYPRPEPVVDLYIDSCTVQGRLGIVGYGVVGCSIINYSVKIDSGEGTESTFNMNTL